VGGLAWAFLAGLGVWEGTEKSLKTIEARTKSAVGWGTRLERSIGEEEKDRIEVMKWKRMFVCFGVGLASVVCAELLETAAKRFGAGVGGTEVKVYENCVEGLSVAPKFPWAFGSSNKIVEFQFTYDNVFSVDVVDGKIALINAAGVQHKIYAMNAREIRDAIMSRKT
jgi:hypothetical protein